MLNQLLDLNRPKNLDTRQPGNLITQLEKGYVKTILAFAENGIDAKDFTIFEFRTTLERFDELNAKHKEDMDKIKTQGK